MSALLSVCIKTRNAKKTCSCRSYLSRQKVALNLRPDAGPIAADKSGQDSTKSIKTSGYVSHGSTNLARFPILWGTEKKITLLALFVEGRKELRPNLNEKITFLD